MAQHGGKSEEFSWLTERKKLVSNLQTLRNAAESMAEKTSELHKLLEEVQLNLAASRSLKVELNKAALRFSQALIRPKEPKD